MQYKVISVSRGCVTGSSSTSLTAAQRLLLA